MLGYNRPSMAVVAPNPAQLNLTELEEEGRRILSSQTFSRCPRLRSFLSHVIQCAIEERLHEVNEYSLGLAVFGKPSTFTPQEDNIVRVTARQLRVKMEEYYHREGAADPWRIEIPKGAYVPLLLPNAPEGSWGLAVAGESTPDVEPASETPATQTHWGWLERIRAPRVAILLLAALAVAGWGLAVWLAFGGTAGTESTSIPSAFALEALFEDPSIPTTVLLDDPLLPMARRGLTVVPTLDQFINGVYLNADLYSEPIRSTLYPTIAAGNLVRPDALLYYSQLREVATARGAEIQPLQARKFAPKQLGQGNLILMGGVGSNPWVAAFQEHLAFEHIVEMGGRRRIFRNRSPKPGEPATYVTSETQSPNQKFYTRVAVMPNPYGAGKVALLGGTSLQSTSGAWRFALSERGATEILQHCGAEPKALSKFELILETKSVGTTPTAWNVQAVRCGPVGR